MANQTRRLTPSVLDEDERGFTVLQTMTLYEPANLAYSVPSLVKAHGLLESARREEAQAEVALDTARDNAVAQEWAFHNLMLSVKDQVIAQFGRDSNEVQAMGLKKTSERKAPRRSQTKGETNS